MKKILSVVLSIVLALSCIGCFAFAADAPEMSKTEAFVKGMENGVGVKADIGTNFISGELFVKENKAVANANIGPINAKAILDNGKFNAYFFIFSADLTNVVPDSTIRKLTDIVNAVPKTFKELKTDIVFKYLTAEKFEANADGKFVEYFVPNYEAIAQLIVDESDGALNDVDKSDIKAFCEEYSQGHTLAASLMDAHAEFTYEDVTAKTLVAATLSIPNSMGVLENLNVFTLFLQNSGIKISYITTDFDENVFDKPFALLPITWLIKLIILAA